MMGIKKLVTITVEAEIEIELAEWASNPTVEDIEGVCDCGFYVENSDDIYKTAARLVLNGYATSNNDVFGIIYPEWKKEIRQILNMTHFMRSKILKLKTIQYRKLRSKYNDSTHTRY